MRWPTGTDVTAIRSRSNTYSTFYLGVQKGKERTSGCGVHGGAGTIFTGCHYAIGALDTYDDDEYSLTFGTVGILAATDIQPGMTLAVGTLDDPFAYGSARIRNVNAGADIIYLEPNNLAAEGYLIAGDYIWVDGVYRLYRILPYILNGVVYEDGNPDTLLGAAGIPGYGVAFAANYLDRPVALMGSPRFAWTGEGIYFYGWRSHGRGGNTVNAYAWDFDGGTVGGAGAAAPGTPTAPVMAYWDTAGEYIASLTVTDNSGKVGNDAYGVAFTNHVAVRPVLVYDRPGGSNPPYTQFNVKSLRGSYGSGWTASIEVFGTADKSEFPDNALIIIFAEDWYGGVRQSRGGWYGQEGILFCGYILADSVQVDSEKSTVSFEARTIEQWMKDVDCWPINFESTAGAPTAWHEFQAMTCEDTLWYLAELRSTLKHVTDCFFASDVNAQKTLGFLDVTESSLYDQMSDQIGSCFFGQVSASRHGSVHLFKHKNMMDLDERTVYGPPIWAFAKQDWRDELEIGDERMRDSVAQVDFIGFIYDTDGNPQEVYSLAPERQTCFGMIEKVTGVLLSGNTIAAAQTENNVLSGLYRAWKNIRFPHIRIPAKNNRFLEPACLDYFSVILVAGDTVRGYEWSGKEFLCTEVSYEIDNEKGVILADVTGEASTWGPEGVAGNYPSHPPDFDDEDPPEYVGEWPDIDPPPWGGLSACPWPVGVGTSANGFYITNDITANPPTWTARNNGLASLDIYDIDMRTDEIGNQMMYMANATGVARSTDYAVTWEQLTLPDPSNDAGDAPPPTLADLDFVSVKIDPTDINRVIVLARALLVALTGHRTWVYRTENALAANPTWDSYQLPNPDIGGAQTDPWNIYLMGLSSSGCDQLDIGLNGDIWVMGLPIWTQGGFVAYSPWAYLSPDGGDNYNYHAVASFVPTAPNFNFNVWSSGIHVDFSDYLVAYGSGFFFNNVGAGQAERCRKTIDRARTLAASFSTEEDGLPAIAPPNYNFIRTLRIDPLDSDHLLAVVSEALHGGGNEFLYESSDAADNWSVLDGAFNIYTTDYKLLATGDAGVVVFCDTNDIYYSIDYGVTALNRTGALPGGHRVIALPNKVW